jgi:predicted metal-dependent hydrolase
LEKNALKIDIEGNLYDCFISKKKISRIIMKVNALLQINIKFPLIFSQSKCLDFIDKNSEWLKTTIKERREIYNKMHVVECLERKGIWLKGKYYNFQYSNNNILYLFDKNNLYIPKKQIIDKTFIEKLRKPFYNEIENMFNSFKTIYSNIIPNDTILTFKRLKTKWGSCNYKKNIIVINKALVSVPDEILQFVFIHEFVHFIFPNHGIKFKEKLNSLLPNYKVLEKELKNYNFLLEKGVF